MCLHPEEISPVPEATALVAKSAFPKGNLYMRLRDELGVFYHDEDSPHIITHVETTLSKIERFLRQPHPISGMGPRHLRRTSVF
jgi:hypothetical protein